MNRCKRKIALPVLALIAAAGLSSGLLSVARAAAHTVTYTAANTATHAAAPVTVRDAWVRAPAPGQTDAGVFFRLVSRSDATLVGATSPIAAMATIHSMRVVDGEMTMRAIPRLALPAGVEVSLEHRHHLMLMGLKKPLHVGETVPLTLLVVDRTGTRLRIPVEAQVRPLDAMEPQTTMPMQMPMH